MSITLILNGKQRRKLHLPKQRLAWVGGILFTVLALSGGWLWQSWQQKMEALEVALAMAPYARVLAEFDLPMQRFVMVGNSLRSDIEPVVRLGGWGVHMPYEVTWAHELENGLEPAHRARIASVDAPAGIPRAVAGLRAKAVMA